MKNEVSFLEKFILVGKSSGDTFYYYNIKPLTIILSISFAGKSSVIEDYKLECKNASINT